MKSPRWWRWRWACRSLRRFIRPGARRASILSRRCVMNDALKTAALKLDHVARRYAEGDGTLEVFGDVSAQLVPGELVARVGPPGAGKSSLLHMAGLLETPSGGDVFLNGVAASRLADRERTRLRRETIGF